MMYKVDYGFHGKESEVYVSSIKETIELKDRIGKYTDYYHVREVIPVDKPRLLWIIRETGESFGIEFAGLTNTMDDPIVSTSLVDGHKFAIVASESEDAALEIGIKLIKELI